MRSFLCLLIYLGFKSRPEMQDQNQHHDQHHDCRVVLTHFTILKRIYCMEKISFIETIYGQSKNQRFAQL